MTKIHVKTNINGDKVEFLADPRETLLDCLRDHIGLTGSKEGCGTGDCGACSCIFDGNLVSSCLVLGVEAEGKSIETIEGMAGEKELHPLQKKFIEMVENHEFPKLAKLSWRNSDLEFGSIKKLIDSLVEKQNNNKNYNIYDHIDSVILKHFKSLNDLHKNGLVKYFNQLKTTILTDNLIPLILYGGDGANKNKDYYTYIKNDGKKITLSRYSICYILLRDYIKFDNYE